MRVMLKATLDTEKSSDVIESGKMPELLQSVLGKIKPEAAYFLPDGGQRTCVLFFDMQDSSELPPLTEPFFLQLGAKVEVTPAMNLDDVQKGLAAISR
jgi:hypothetical protein